MKFFALVALASASAVEVEPVDQEALKQAQDDALKLQLDGWKGFYDGYTRSFYKINSHETVNENCLDDTTVDNIIAYSDIIHDPFSLLNFSKIHEDLNLFAEGAEIMSDLSNCKFEQSIFDIMAMCKEVDEDGVSKCAMSHITENLTKNMFVLIGKMTSLAETLQGFPDADPEQYEDRETKYQYIVHAEMNCIYNAAMNGVSLYGSTLYIYPLPACHECAKGIIQCGIERVVSPAFENEFTQKRWEQSCTTTFEMFEEAGIQYDLVKGFTSV